MPSAAIRRRLESGRLHPLHRGIYAVGRAEVSELGHFMAAVLACGPEARLSHRSGAALWGIRLQNGGLIDVTIPPGTGRRRPGIKLHRRALPPSRLVHRIPVGDPLSILSGGPARTDRQPPAAEALDSVPTRSGVGALRALLDSQTFSRSQTALERRFLPIARAAGLPAPGRQVRLGKYRVDFHWPALRLVVEADSLTYHRTVAQQTTDMMRDQTHARAGLHTLRFNHRQVFREPSYVREVLEDAVRHLP